MVSEQVRVARKRREEPSASKRVNQQEKEYINAMMACDHGSKASIQLKEDKTSLNCCLLASFPFGAFLWYSTYLIRGKISNKSWSISTWFKHIPFPYIKQERIFKKKKHAPLDLLSLIFFLNPTFIPQMKGRYY